MTLQEILDKQIEFSKKTFGKISFTVPLHHLKKEIQEVIDAYDKPFDDECNGSLIEFADCLLLILDAFWRRHPDLNAEDLIRASLNKIKINEKRKWSPSENGTFRHIENGSM